MRDRLRFLPHGLLLLACGGPERSTDTPKAPLGPTSAKAIDPFSWKGSPYDVEAMMKAPLDSMETSECKYVAVEMEKLRKTSKSEAEASKKVEAKTQGPGKDADCWKSWLKLVALAHDFAVRGGEAPGLLVSIAQSARRHSDCLVPAKEFSPGDPAPKLGDAPGADDAGWKCIDPQGVQRSLMHWNRYGFDYDASKKAFVVYAVRVDFPATLFVRSDASDTAPLVVLEKTE